MVQAIVLYTHYSTTSSKYGTVFGLQALLQRFCKTLYGHFKSKTCSIDFVLTEVRHFHLRMHYLLCSIMGEGEQLGIVPRFMRELFDRIDGTSDSKVTGWCGVDTSY